MPKVESFNLSVLFKAVDELSRPVRSMGKTIAKMKAPIKRAGIALVKLGEKAAAAGKKMQDVGKKMITRVTLPILGFAGAAIKAAADLETLEIGLTSLTGSTEKAKEVVKELVQFTAKTPFQLEGVGKAARQLLAFGVSTDDLQDKLKFLGDIAAGTDAPLSDIAQIFGKIKVQGKAMTEELQQLGFKGTPIIKVLAKQMGVAESAVFKMASKGKISFDVMEKAMRSMTEKGGAFENQMEKKSKSVAGIFSTLKDAIVIALGEVGFELIKAFELKKNMIKLIKFIEELVIKFKDFAKENPKMVKLVFTIATIAAAAGPLIFIFGTFLKIFGPLIKFFKIFIFLGKGLIFIIKGMKALAAVAGGPVILAIIAIALAAFLIIKYWKPIKSFLSNLGKSIVSLFRRILEAIKNLWKRLINFIIKKWQQFVNWFVENKETIINVALAILTTMNPLVGLPLLILANWKKVVAFLVQAKDVIKEFLGFVTPPGGELKVKGATEINKATTNISKSQTEVNIKVSSDQGTTATVERVKKKRGNARVKVASEGFTGGVIPGVPGFSAAGG